MEVLNDLHFYALCLSYFARKYICIGTPENKAPPFAKGRGWGGNVETDFSESSAKVQPPTITILLGNKSASEHPKNPTVRASCSPRNGDRGREYIAAD